MVHGPMVTSRGWAMTATPPQSCTSLIAWSRGKKRLGMLQGMRYRWKASSTVAGVSFRDERPPQMGAPHGVPGGFLDLVEIKGCPAVSPEAFVDPVEDAPVALQAE